MRTSPKHLLWITPKWPLPAEDGARVATVRLISVLAERDYRIDLLALAGHDEEIEEREAVSRLGVSQTFVVRRGLSGARGVRGKLLAGISLLNPHALPVTFLPYASPSVKAAIQSILGESRWFGVVYDGLHPAAHSSRNGLFKSPPGVDHVFYRAHNLEGEIWSRKAMQTRNPVLRMLLGLQAARVSRFEKSVLESVEGVAPVSSEDWKSIHSLSPGARGVVVPIGYDFGVTPPVFPSGAQTEILFVGRLDWPPNREGLKWFLEKIWPTLTKKREDLKLSIVGTGDGAWVRQAVSGMPRAEFLGRVEDLAPLYARSSISLVPVFFGSGTRVKVIEASRYARPCLSTSLGVEGTGLQPNKSYFQAETEAEWIGALSLLERSRASEVGISAYHELREAFDVRRAADRFEEVLRVRE